MKELLTLRKAKKEKKPVFNHQDSWKRKRLPKKWRKPKGMHSKMRMKFKGNPRLPSQGYRSPRQVRGLHGLGVDTILVRSLKQLESLASGAIIIASSIGARKKLEMIKKAEEKKLSIVNLDPDEYGKKVKRSIEERSKKKETRKAETERSQKDEKPKKGKEARKPESPEKGADQEEKADESKKEMEKIITKRK